jgi:hypothetical protein
VNKVDGGPPAHRRHAEEPRGQPHHQYRRGGPRSIQDSRSIRSTALQNRITYYTTVAGARAAAVGLRHLGELRAYDLQSLHASIH